jgi:DNA invertase Pin-like site-specific DNA recombinase
MTTTPTSNKYVAYYRVSTRKQDLGLDAQQMAVETYLAHNGGQLVATFAEKESGKNDKRLELTKALRECRQQKATLIIAKLDRLSRNAEFLMHLNNSDVNFLALDLPFANTLTIGVMASFAQHEREMISKRTKEGLAAKRARGETMPHNYDFTPSDRAKAYKAHAKSAQDNENNRMTVYEIRQYLANGGDSSLRAIAKHLNEIGCTTSRGKFHTHNTVAHVCKYFNIERL